MSEEKVVNDVNEYSKRNGFETIRNEDKLEIDISGKKYWLQASIGEGSADSISLYFHECLFQ